MTLFTFGNPTKIGFFVVTMIIKRTIQFLLFVPLFTACGGNESADADETTIDSTYCNCNDLFFDEAYNNFYRTDRRVGFSGTCETFFPNGQRKMQKHFVDGKVNGKLNTFYDNGQLESEREFDMNLQTGEQINYTPDGEVMFHALYKYGKQTKVLVTRPELLKKYGLD